MQTDLRSFDRSPNMIQSLAMISEGVPEMSEHVYSREHAWLKLLLRFTFIGKPNERL